MKHQQIRFTFITLFLMLVGCNLPSSNPQPANLPALLFITSPTNYSTWPQFASVPVLATVNENQEIASLALYVNGNLQSTLPLDGQQLVQFNWLVSSEGEHSLIIRALDSNGQAIGQSNILRVQGSQNPLSYSKLYLTQEGNTLEKIAEQNQVSPQSLLLANPAVNTASQIAAGSPIHIPFQLEAPPLPPSPAPSFTSPSVPASAYAPNIFTNWFNSFNPPEPPTAPALSAMAEGCSVHLSIGDLSNNEDGFNLYRFAGGATGFEKIATLSGGSGESLSFVDSGQSGQTTYYASAFNAGGESNGGLAGVTINTLTCASASAGPAAGFINQPGGAIPEDSFNPALTQNFYDKVYFYIALDGSPWSRAPRLPDDFYIPENGLLNIDQAIDNFTTPPSSGQTVVDVEAWGWQGGNLIFIGRFQRILHAEGNSYFVLDGGRLSTCEFGTCSGEFNSFTIEEHGITSLGNQEFRWETTNSAITEGVWQIASTPFNNSCEVNPSTLLLSGSLIKSQNISDFTVDLSPLPTVLNVYGWVPSPTRYYMRILPVINGTPECSPTNTVSLMLGEQQAVVVEAPPTAPAPPVPYEIEIIEYTPIIFPTPGFHNCVQIIENPFYGVEIEIDPVTGNPIDKNTGEFVPLEAYLYQDKWAPGETICPNPYEYEEPSFWEQAGTFIKDLINGVSWFYNSLVSGLKYIVAKFNPICLQGELIAGELGPDYEGAVEDACAFAADIVVNAALTYVGLPPSLPNYDELVEIGKGQVVDFAAQQIEEQTGVPCPDVCKELIKDALNETLQQIEHQLANQQACIGEADAHNRGFEPLCIPASIRAQPEPRGQVQPDVIKILLTRKPDSPDLAFPDPELFKTSCSVSVGGFAKNSSWVGKSVLIDPYSNNSSKWQGTEISGYLFNSAKQPAPPLAPGESAQLTFALTPNRGSYPPGNGFWLPGHLAYLQNKYDQSQLENYYGNTSDDWTFLYSGANATLTAYASCTTSAPGYQTGNSQVTDTLETILPAIQE